MLLNVDLFISISKEPVMNVDIDFHCIARKSGCVEK